MTFVPPPLPPGAAFPLSRDVAKVLAEAKNAERARQARTGGPRDDEPRRHPVRRLARALLRR